MILVEDSEFHSICPSPGSISKIIMALYVLLTSVILLSTLIAMLSKLYDEIKGNADNVWSWNRFDIILEGI